MYTVIADIAFNGKRGHNRNEIKVQAPYVMKDLIKECGGNFNSEDRTWYVPLSWASCLRLRGTFGAQLKIGSELKAWAAQVRRDVTDAMEWRDRDAPPKPEPGSDLYPHQQAGTGFLRRAPEALLSDEMGTGKTATLLNSMRHYHEMHLPAIVICPSSVKRNWAREAERWLPEATPYVVDGTAPQRAKILAKAADDPLALVIINFESARMHSRLAAYGSTALTKCKDCDRTSGNPNITAAKCETHLKELNRIPFQTVIIDEAHRLKDPQSKQTRAVWAIASGEHVRYRWAATGTPIADNPGDLWPILRTISPTQFPVKTHFVDRYCVLSFNPFGGMDVTGLRPDRKAEFEAIFHPMFRRMVKERILTDLPPKIPSTRYAPMTPKQAKAYKEMEAAYATELDSGWLTATSEDPNGAHLVAANRLMQFASAYADVYEKPDPEKGSTWKVALKAPSNKIDVFMEILEENGGRPIVACAQHRQVVELASERLTEAKIPHSLIVGGQSASERERALTDFQEGRVNVLLFTIQAGGTGLTMTRADTLVFLQRSWSMIDNQQAEDRVHRIGSALHKSVHIIDIVAPGTIEEHQRERVAAKQERAKEITG